MNIIVAGCGKIGSALVQTLEKEGHDLTVIDTSAEVITEMTNIYDVMGVCGSATDCETLSEAGIDKARLFIAVTDSDELNMLSCYIAKKMGAHHTVARIRNPEYNDRSLGFLREQLNISMAINPEFLLAQELYNLLRLPSAFKVDYFARRTLEMIEIRLKEDSPLCDKKLFRLREKQNIQFLIGAVLRNGELIIPDGNFELRAGDTISLTASTGDMQRLLKSLGILRKESRNIMLMGGGKTSYYLAKQLLSSGSDVKIIEKKEERCLALSDNLPDAVLIHGDGTRQELLLEEGLRSLDAFVTLTGMDEENILTGLFASGQNVPQVIAKVNRPELASMAVRLGLDHTISTKTITSDIVLRYARALENSRGSNVETLYKIMDGKAEALEFNVKPGSAVIGTPLKDMKIKSGILIAGIIRSHKKAVIPTGNDSIAEGDKVIVLAADRRLSDLDDILR